MSDQPFQTRKNTTPRPEQTGLLGAVDRTLTRVIEHPSVPRQFIHIAKMVVLGMRRVQIPRMAAALSYRTLFGVIPVLVIGVVFVAAFSSQEVVTSRIRDVMKYAGLDQIAVPQDEDESAFFQGGKDNPTATTPDTHAGEAAVHSTAKVDEWVQALVNRVRQLPPGTLSIVGVVTLIYAAISMLVEIEKSFNQIYMAPAGRSWSRRIIQYWAMLTLGAFGLLAALPAQEIIARAVEHLTESNFISDFQAVILTVTGEVVAILITTALLLIVYTSVPNTRVRPGAALTGALLAAVLWQASKYGFKQYVELAVGYSKLYGPIAILPLFLLWVYVTWLIILSGLQAAHALQSYSTAKAAGLTRSVLETLGLVSDAAEARRTLIVDPASTLVVMCDVAIRFRAGKASGSSIVADKTGIDQRVVSEMLERLWRAGLLHRVSGGEDDGAYTLAAPPEAISARDVLTVGEELTAADRERAPKLLGELSAARHSALNGRFLADLLPAASVKAAPPALPADSASPRPATG